MKVKVKDPIIKKVINKIAGRSKVGYKKYGVTLMEDKANLDGWLNHLQEELMDAVNYIERAREELDRANIKVNSPVALEDECDFKSKYACTCKDVCIGKIYK